MELPKTSNEIIAPTEKMIRLTSCTFIHPAASLEFDILIGCCVDCDVWIGRLVGLMMVWD